jgi:GNAT superfamily N-acetyltransferase
VRIDIAEEPLDDEYGRISMAFEVRPALGVPYVKDFAGPAEWRASFDVSKWGCVVAWVDGHRVGGAVIAFDTPGVTMLEGRRDLAVLWDLRVAPEMRGRGVGTALFREVEKWAIAHGCRELEIETQNTNVRACRFYERRGCELRDSHPVGDEVQLLWWKPLR